MNEIRLSGNLTRDPELKTFDNGNSVVNLSMASNRNVLKRDGDPKNQDDWTEYTTFMDVVVWSDSMQDRIMYDLSQGSPVTVSGRLDQRNWETADGEKRNKYEIVASEVIPSAKWTPKAERQGGGNALDAGQASTASDDPFDEL